MNRHLRHLIHHYRTDKNLNFGQLSDLCGYGNRNKWAAKICNFEREGIGSDELIRKLIRSLELDLNEVRIANKKDIDDLEKWLNEPVPMQLIMKPNIGIYFDAKIPDEFDNQEKALKYASSIAKEKNWEACLLLNRKECIWFKRDGSLKFKGTKNNGVVNNPHMSVGNKQFLFGVNL